MVVSVRFSIMAFELKAYTISDMQHLLLILYLYT